MVGRSRVRSGSFNKRVTFQRQSSTRTGVGQLVDTWTDLGEGWCSINGLNGREFLAQSGEKAEVTHKIRTRARNDIGLAPRDRILHASRVFDIEAVLEEFENGRVVVIMAKEQKQTNG